jgi:translation initiation factor eIF-2B subunit epsilon
MRDLDSRGHISGDFLLVAGDVVSNVSLEPALARHRARREKDKNAVMTMLLREAGPEHRTKPQRNRPVFVIAPQSDRCLWYDEMWRQKDSAHNLELDPEFLSAHSEIEIRSDLLDCGVDICTPDVLSLWSENFDFNSVRRGFLRGVLKDYELNGKTFHTHITTNGYAARVRDLRAYDAISRDMIGRWTYPMTPDCNLFAGQTYQLGQNKTYIEDGVSLARGSHIHRRSVVGRGTSVGLNSTITDSIVGRGCHIGNNVTIRGGYVWPNCSIGDDSVVEGAVIADEVYIGRGCSVAPGCLLSYNVRVADGIKVPERSRLTRSSTVKKTKEAANLVGTGGDGQAYHTPSSSAASSPAASPLLASTTRRDSFTSSFSISTVHSHDSPSSSRRASSASHDALRIATAYIPLGTSPDSAVFAADAGLGDKSAAAKARIQRDFLGEATTSIYDGLAAQEPADKIRLELVAQRLAADASDTAVRDALVAAFLQRTWALIEAPQNPWTPAKAVKAIWALDKYGWLLAQMGMFDIGTTSAMPGATWIKPDQVAVLRAVEASAANEKRSKGRELLLFIVREGVDGNWLQLEGVEEWWAGEGQPTGSGKQDVPPIRGLVKAYVEYLRDSDEESSEDESEDESE